MLFNRLKLGVLAGLMAGGILGVAEENETRELGPVPRWLKQERRPRPTPPLQFSQNVNPANRQEVVDFYRTNYLTAVGIPIEWNGNTTNCVAGTNSTAFAEATVLRVNYFRAMAGLPGDVTLDENWNHKCQEAALMMSAEGRLSHNPGPNWACYSVDGAEAAGKSNLYHGRDGPGAIDGYMDDWGSINYYVGHRRWILYPPQKVMGTGSIPLVGGRLGANVLWVIGGFGTRPSQPAWVAWPPGGFVPYQVMPRVSRRWSFSLPGADFSGATVTMTAFSTNVPVTLEAQENNKGYADNTLVWIPEGVPTGAPVQDLAYTVTLTNVVVSGLPQSYTYTVTLIDPDQPGLEPPVITHHPEDQTVTEGAMAVFSVSATGTEPLSYQWLFENLALASKTNATLNLLNVTDAVAGLYAVEVSNQAGRLTSNPARLEVVPVAAPAFESVGFESGILTLTWAGEAILQEAIHIIGPWTDLRDASSPMAIPTERQAAFYRLRWP